MRNRHEPRWVGSRAILTKVAYQPKRNKLKVVVDRTTKIKEGDHIALRLLETARIKGVRIPKQSRLIAQAKKRRTDTDVLC